MNPFRLVDLTSANNALIQQTAHVAYAASQSLSTTWLPTIADAVEEVLESLSHEGISHVLLDQQRVVAWVSAFPQFNGRVVEIHPLIVAQAYQGQGWGRRMVNHVEAWAKAQGALTLWLSTSDEANATSLSDCDLYADPGDAIARFHQSAPHPCGFWQKLGFQIVGVLPDAEGRGQPSIMLAKSL
jgi:aminoglycoside 6'-N-acetyltransferase I